MIRAKFVFGFAPAFFIVAGVVLEIADPQFDNLTAYAAMSVALTCASRLVVVSDELADLRRQILPAHSDTDGDTK